MKRMTKGGSLHPGVVSGEEGRNECERWGVGPSPPRISSTRTSREAEGSCACATGCDERAAERERNLPESRAKASARAGGSEGRRGNRRVAIELCAPGRRGAWGSRGASDG